MEFSSTGYGMVQEIGRKESASRVTSTDSMVIVQRG